MQLAGGQIHFSRHVADGVQQIAFLDAVQPRLHLGGTQAELFPNFLRVQHRRFHVLNKALLYRQVSVFQAQLLFTRKQRGGDAGAVFDLVLGQGGEGSGIDHPFHAALQDQADSVLPVIVYSDFLHASSFPGDGAGRPPVSSGGAVLVNAHGGRFADHDARAEPLIQTHLIGQVVDVGGFGGLHVALEQHLQGPHVRGRGGGQDIQPLFVDHGGHVIFLIGVDQVDDLGPIIGADEPGAVDLLDDGRRELLGGRGGGKAGLLRQLADDVNIAQQRHSAGAHPMLEHGIQYRFDDARAGAVEGRRPVIGSAVQHALDVGDLLGGHFIGGVPDQVGHLHPAGAQLIQVDHRPGGYRDGIQGDLLVGDLAAGGGSSLGLEERPDAVDLHAEGGFFAVVYVFGVRHMVQPVGGGLHHFVDRKAYQLADQVLVVGRGIGGLFSDQPGRLFRLVAVHALTVGLGNDELYQLGIIPDLNGIHSASPQFVCLATVPPEAGCTVSPAERAANSVLSTVMMTCSPGSSRFMRTYLPVGRV